MIHRPISLNHICLSFRTTMCFEDFSTQIHYGSRIAIIGRNGSGKSTLLKLLLGTAEASSGERHVPTDVTFGYVPQALDTATSLSGGQRLNQSLTAALARDPNVLLLDEPTNHLDAKNRKSLLRKVNDFYGTLIIVTHDTEVLRNCIDTLWHIDNGCIAEFSGNYDDYRRESDKKRLTIEKKLTLLKREKQDMHTSLMKEQNRAAKSKSKGKKNIKQRKWPTVVSQAKASRAEKTSGMKKMAIDQKKSALTEELTSLQLPDVIRPNFALSPSNKVHGVLVSINNGSIGYPSQEPLINNIHLSLSSQDRMAITGDNGSGKTTLIKTILSDPDVNTTGDWILPKRDHIGYLDQHYSNIEEDKSALQSLSDIAPSWDITQVRRHLNDFLFKSDDDVNTPCCHLSGGEKARLSLALIAACPPKLLVLDEITNNLDLETLAHVLQILQHYPAAMMIISHDEDFLRKINCNIHMKIHNQYLTEEK
jgi:ATPase subunit of ABC transporter with duplicated ATPase domains